MSDLLEGLARLVGGVIAILAVLLAVALVVGIGLDLLG
jgi:hypothetical protein